MNLRGNLQNLGHPLPEPPPPAANYQRAVTADGLMYISGQLPLTDGRLLATGKVGRDVSLDTAVDCARQCALNTLAVADRELGGDWKFRFQRLIKLTVYVASDPAFTDQHLVANGASDLYKDALFRQGEHARAAVGCASLPLDAPVELELILRYREDIARSD